jgi:nitric oxide reductase subunit B
MEYWRWWVVHLWVEGFFEVFATAAIALIIARMGLIERKSPGAAVVESSALFLLPTESSIAGSLHCFVPTPK